MKRRCLSLLLLLLFCFAPAAKADVSARDGEGLALAPGESRPPASALRITFTLEALPESPALRLRLRGMTLVSVSFHTRGATLQPEIIYGSDGCVFLFTGPLAPGDTILLKAMLRDTPGEAAASLLLEGEPWMEFSCAAQAAASSAAAVPAMAAAVPETAKSAPTPPEEASASGTALIIFCVLGLGVAGYMCILRPRLRAKGKGNGGADG